MHPTLNLILAVLTGGVTAWAVADVRSGPDPVASAPAAPRAEDGLASFEQRLDRLADQVEALSMSSPAPEARPARSPAPAALDAAAIETAVRRLVNEQALRVEDEAALAAIEWPGGFATARDAVRSILDLGIDSEEARALWKQADENDQLHALLEAMETELEGEPETSEKHTERARAYYAAARARPSNVDGNWWVDSDDAYTRALELDPQNWDARFQKARNQSFWPTAYGGQAEAIRHFEMLIGQQERRAPEERFAQSYVWLGNLYDQQGRTDEARQTWEQGLRVFPGDDWLSKKLATLSK